MKSPTFATVASPRPVSTRSITIDQLDRLVLHRAKRAFTTRRVPPHAMRQCISGPVRPRTGDVVLARVDRIGHHAKLELTTGRRAHLNIGDEIIVAYGNRYAPDQFEAEVPLGLWPTQLVASGGIASHMLSRCDTTKRATDITPIGLVADDRGVPLNLADFSLVAPPRCDDRPPTIAVLGTSMNSGKTTTAHRLLRGLAAAGHTPGATKVTGTGSGGDYWLMIDAGARMMLDFTDVGLASTYRVDISLVQSKAVQLLDHLAHAGCGAIVMEIADGIFQQETSWLIASEEFRSKIDGVVFAAADSMGAVCGLDRLHALGLSVKAVAGRVTRSPLGTREVVESTDVPVLSLSELADPAIASHIFGFEPPRPAAVPEADGASVADERTFEETRSEQESQSAVMAPVAGRVAGATSESFA